jgi:anti-sigma B factor antagonist
MEVNFKTMQATSSTAGITVVEMIGDLDSGTVPPTQEKILPLAQPGAQVVVDMTQVGYMSSAGLRMLLLLYRSISGRGGKVVLVGLSQDLQDTMSMTGFLDFFEHFDNLDAGLAAVTG